MQRRGRIQLRADERGGTRETGKGRANARERRISEKKGRVEKGRIYPLQRFVSFAWGKALVAGGPCSLARWEPEKGPSQTFTTIPTVYSHPPMYASSAWKSTPRDGRIAIVGLVSAIVQLVDFGGSSNVLMNSTLTSMRCPEPFRTLKRSLFKGSNPFPFQSADRIHACRRRVRLLRMDQSLLCSLARKDLPLFLRQLASDLCQ
jgi:hypothetical protein